MDNFIQIAAFCQPSQLKATTHVLISVDNSKHHSSAICGLWGWEDPCFFTQDGWSGSQESNATFTFSIMHLICPPKFFLTFVFSFLLGITAVPREIENKAYAKFWGANKVHYVENVDMAMKAFNTQRLVIKFPERTPWPEEEMRDLSGLLGFGALWRIGTLFFDAGEVFELRLHTVIFLASHYVGKQHRTTRSKTV